MNGKMFLASLVSGVYDFYKDGKTGYGSRYYQLSRDTLTAERGIYDILLTVAVYASGIAFMLACISLEIHSKSKGEKREGAKKKIMRVLIISALIFAVTSIVQFVYNAGLK